MIKKIFKKEYWFVSSSDGTPKIINSHESKIEQIIFKNPKWVSGNLTLNKKTLPFNRNFWFLSPIYDDIHQDKIDKIINKI